MRVLAEASCTLLKQLMLAVPLPVLELLLCKTPPAALLNLPEFDMVQKHSTWGRMHAFRKGEQGLVREGG